LVVTITVGYTFYPPDVLASIFLSVHRKRLDCFKVALVWHGLVRSNEMNLCRQTILWNYQLYEHFVSSNITKLLGVNEFISIIFMSHKLYIVNIWDVTYILPFCLHKYIRKYYIIYSYNIFVILYRGLCFGKKCCSPSFSRCGICMYTVYIYNWFTNTRKVYNGC